MLHADGHTALTCSMDIQHWHAAWTCIEDMHRRHAAGNAVMTTRVNYCTWLQEQKRERYTCFLKKLVSKHSKTVPFFSVTVCSAFRFVLLRRFGWFGPFFRSFRLVMHLKSAVSLLSETANTNPYVLRRREKNIAPVSLSFRSTEQWTAHLNSLFPIGWMYGLQSLFSSKKLNT